MRRYFSLFYFVLLSIIAQSSIVCAENIAGFPFGEKFEHYSKFTELKNQRAVLPHEYQANNVKFFDFAQIGTDEKRTIKTLVFQKEYRISTHNLTVKKQKILDDFHRLLDAIEKKYGQFDKSKAKSLFGLLGESNLIFMNALSESVVNQSPKSSQIGSIYIFLDSPEDKNFTLGSEKKVTLSLLYVDKAFAKQMKQEKEDELSDF